MRRWAISLSLLVSLYVATAPAQTPTGTLQGGVTDPSGASVPGATIKITNTQTNEGRSLTTDSGGRFVQPLLPPGTYQIEASSQGFQPVRVDNIKLDVGQNRSVDFKLSVSTALTEVDVSANAVALDVNTSAMGQVITNRSILDLPLNGRNPFDLAALSPGVSTIGGASTPHIGGSRNGNNEQQIDGISNITPENNVGNNGTAYTPIVDSVQEFSVQINTLSAEYGRFGGGVINVVTKSGTNELHGSAYEFARNAVLDSNDFFSNKYGASKPDMHRNQFGGTIGGPIYIPHAYNGRNRSFFFFGFEGSKEASLANETNSVPTDAARKGDFSQYPTLIYDPLTVNASGVRSPFPGNVVPGNRMDPVGKNMMGYYPEPNVGGPGAIFNNVFLVGNNTDDNKNFLGPRGSQFQRQVAGLPAPLAHLGHQQPVQRLRDGGGARMGRPDDRRIVERVDGPHVYDQPDAAGGSAVRPEPVGRVPVSVLAGLRPDDAGILAAVRGRRGAAQLGVPGLRDVERVQRAGAERVGAPDRESADAPGLRERHEDPEPAHHQDGRRVSQAVPELHPIRAPGRAVQLRHQLDAEGGEPVRRLGEPVRGAAARNGQQRLYDARTDGGGRQQLHGLVCAGRFQSHPQPDAEPGAAVGCGVPAHGALQPAFVLGPDGGLAAGRKGERDGRGLSVMRQPDGSYELRGYGGVQIRPRAGADAVA